MTAITWGEPTRSRQLTWAQEVVAQTQLATLIDRLPPSLTITVHWASTVPSGHTDYAYTTLADNAATITIKNNLDNPTGTQDFSGDQFYKETVVHELCHVISFYMVNDDTKRTTVAAMFTNASAVVGVLADWNPLDRPWTDRIEEAVAETMKDLLFVGRRHNNRTSWALTHSQLAAFVTAVMPGPLITPGSSETVRYLGTREPGTPSLVDPPEVPDRTVGPYSTYTLLTSGTVDEGSPAFMNGRLFDSVYASDDVIQLNPPELSNNNWGVIHGPGGNASLSEAGIGVITQERGFNSRHRAFARLVGEGGVRGGPTTEGVWEFGGSTFPFQLNLLTLRVTDGSQTFELSLISPLGEAFATDSGGLIEEAFIAFSGPGFQHATYNAFGFGEGLLSTQHWHDLPLPTPGGGLYVYVYPYLADFRLDVADDGIVTATALVSSWAWEQSPDAPGLLTNDAGTLLPWSGASHPVTLTWTSPVALLANTDIKFEIVVGKVGGTRYSDSPWQGVLVDEYQVFGQHLDPPFNGPQDLSFAWPYPPVSLLRAGTINLAVRSVAQHIKTRPVQGRRL